MYNCLHPRCGSERSFCQVSAIADRHAGHTHTFVMTFISFAFSGSSFPCGQTTSAMDIFFWEASPFAELVSTSLVDISVDGTGVPFGVLGFTI